MEFNLNIKIAGALDLYYRQAAVALSQRVSPQSAAAASPSLPRHFPGGMAGLASPAAAAAAAAAAGANPLPPSSVPGAPPPSNLHANAAAAVAAALYSPAAANSRPSSVEKT